MTTENRHPSTLSQISNPNKPLQTELLLLSEDGSLWAYAVLKNRDQPVQLKAAEAAAFVGKRAFGYKVAVVEWGAPNAVFGDDDAFAQKVRELGEPGRAPQAAVDAVLSALRICLPSAPPA